MPQRPDAGLLVHSFPKLAETFILGEVLGLERMGLKLELFALQAPTEKHRVAAVEAVKAPIRYLPRWRWVPPLSLWQDQLRLLRRSPFRFRQALSFLRERSEGGRWHDWFSAGWLACRMLDAGIPHLHSHFIDRTTGVAELAKQLSGIGYSISAHAKDIDASDPKVIRRKLEAARFCVTSTGYNRDHLQRIAGTDTDIHRLYHGVNLQRFRRAEAHTTKANKPPLLLSVGRYREKRGFATLIEACSLLRRRGQDFRCKIVGYGPEHFQLQQQIDVSDLSRHVQLVEPLTHEQLIALYNQAQIFILPAQIARNGDRDDIPQVLLEAMAMELPAISTRVSGIPEVIGHEHTGLLVEPDAADALADAATRLLGEPELSLTLGRNARRFVSEYFSPEANLQPLAQLLRRYGQRANGMAKPALADSSSRYA